MRLKGHTKLYWEEVLAKRENKGKEKVKSYDRMVQNSKENLSQNIIS